MEGDRPRLTTLAVGAALALASACFAAALVRGLEAAPAPGLRDVGPALLRGEGAALVALGVALLLAAPLLRLVGLAVGFWRSGDRVALAAAVVTLLLLALSFLAR